MQIATYASFFNLTPLFPRIGTDLGLDPGTLGALVGVGGIVSLVAQLPAGSGGDAYGRRPFFVAGLGLASVALLIRWQTTSPLMLLLAQVSAGAALGIVSTNAFAVAADVFSGKRQAQAIGVVNASVNVGQVVGYLVAGTLGALVGWRLMSLQLLILPGAVLVLVLVAGVVARRRHGATRPSPVDVLRALGHPRRLAFAGLAALALAVGQGACYLLPFAIEARDLGPLAAAAVLVPYVVGSVVGAPLGGTLAARFGQRAVIVAALTLGVLACAAAALSDSALAVLALCNVGIGVAVNSTLPLIAVSVVTMRGGGAAVGAGTAIAGLRIGQSLGPVLGPTLAGAMLAQAGVGAAWLALAACLVGAVAIYSFQLSSSLPPR